MFQITVIRPSDDLRRLVAEINAAAWDEANEMGEYEEGALAHYLDQQGNLFVVCHEPVEGGRRLLGVASARLQVKPYGRERWLYVDEVDVCADQRCRGVGMALMQALMQAAEAAGCDELWLGAEVDNDAANALYRSLGPEDVAAVTGYTYALGEDDEA
jgi:ribosomal protein S18 acetylase RimI-like enzyme